MEENTLWNRFDDGNKWLVKRRKRENIDFHNSHDLRRYGVADQNVLEISVGDNI